MADPSGGVAVEHDPLFRKNVSFLEQRPELRLLADRARAGVDEFAPVQPDRSGDVSRLVLVSFPGIHDDCVGVIEGGFDRRATDEGTVGVERRRVRHWIRLGDVSRGRLGPVPDGVIPVEEV